VWERRELRTNEGPGLKHVAPYRRQSKFFTLRKACKPSRSKSFVTAPEGQHKFERILHCLSSNNAEAEGGARSLWVPDHRSQYESRNGPGSETLTEKRFYYDRTQSTPPPNTKPKPEKLDFISRYSMLVFLIKFKRGLLELKSAICNRRNSGLHYVPTSLRDSPDFASATSFCPA
jgi:hypothetical protein